MGLETGTYIDSLNASNPVSGDGLNQSDDHHRLIKATIKASFPNISGAMTSSHTELNLLDGETAIASANTASAIVKRDGSGNFSAGTITADLTGTASAVTATDNTADETTYLTFVDGATGSQGIETNTSLTYNPSTGVLTAGSFSGTTSAVNITVADESTDTTCFPVFTTAATGDLPPKTGTNLAFNSSTGALTATSFVGNVTGDLTGNVTGDFTGVSYVRVYPGATDDYASGSVHDIQMDTEQFDTESDFNTTTYTFTAPETGYYYVSVQIATEVVTLSAVAGTINLYVTGTATITPPLQTLYETIANDARSVSRHIKVSGLVYMAAGETIKPQWEHNRGIDMELIGGATGDTWMTIHRVK